MDSDVATRRKVSNGAIATPKGPLFSAVTDTRVMASVKSGLLDDPLDDLDAKIGVAMPMSSLAHSAEQTSTLISEPIIESSPQRFQVSALFVGVSMLGGYSIDLLQSAEATAVAAYTTVVLPQH